MTLPITPETLARALADIGEAAGRRDARAIVAAVQALFPAAETVACDFTDETSGDKARGIEAAMTWGGRKYGRLIVAPAESVSRELLEAIAGAAAAHLAAAELHADLLAEGPRADVGELTGPLVHDVTNLLNNLLLNLAVLEQGGDLSMFNVPRLRTRSEQVTSLIKEVQDYRRRKASATAPADVNAAAREAVELLNHDYADSIGGEYAVELQLGSDVPRVAATRLDLVRCLTFLLKGAVRAARASGKPVRLRTTPAATGAVLRVELPGAQVLVESQSRLFDTLGAVCPGFSSLELATCKSIARRFNGRFSADCPAELGLVLQLELPQ